MDRNAGNAIFGHATWQAQEMSWICNVAACQALLRMSPKAKAAPKEKEKETEKEGEGEGEGEIEIEKEIAIKKEPGWERKKEREGRSAR